MAMHRIAELIELHDKLPWERVRQYCLAAYCFFHAGRRADSEEDIQTPMRLHNDRPHGATVVSEDGSSTLVASKHSEDISGAALSSAIKAGARKTPQRQTVHAPAIRGDVSLIVADSVEACGPGRGFRAIKNRLWDALGRGIAKALEACFMEQLQPRTEGI